MPIGLTVLIAKVMMHLQLGNFNSTYGRMRLMD